MASSTGRDTLIVAVALGLLAYEVVFGGARASVFTVITGILLSPLVARIDERRRNGNRNDRRVDRAEPLQETE